MAGAPQGNQNSSKSNRLWAGTIKRAIKQDDGERLRKIAEKLLDEAAGGNMAAIKELGDRIDGKSIQQVDATVDGNITIEVVRFADTPPE